MSQATKIRPVASYDTINEIIAALNPGKIGNNQTYVGKHYSKENLISDLKRISERGKTP